MWQQIEGYDNYFINREGKIRNLSGKIMRDWCNGKGYRYLTLSNNGTHKNVYVHRLMAKAWLPIIKEKPDVNHKDGNKGNNNINNLEWCNRHDNMRHAHDNKLIKVKTKFTDLEVDIIRRMWSAEIHREKIAKVFNISFAQITRICNYSNRKTQ